MIILDGGMGQELIARAGKVTKLWSVQALLDTPEIVRQVHDDYFNAGADVATSNSYSLLPDRLESHGMEDRLEDLSRLACQIVCDSREAHGAGLVAGALGPQGFSYQPNKCPPAEQAAEGYARIAKIHAAYVDLHLLETMSSIKQVRGGLMGAGVTGLPVWLGLSVADTDGTLLRSGELLSDIVPLLEEFKPEAVLINCSKPEAVSQAMPVLAGFNCRTGAYANGFTEIAAEFNGIGATVDLLRARHDLDPDAYASFAEEWVRNSATIVGGCCEVGPAHIAELARRFNRRDSLAPDHFNVRQSTGT